MENEIKNKTENYEETTYCTRCKIKEAETTCAMCDPFKYFCGSCNENVHSVPSKKFHVRRKIHEKLLDSISNQKEEDSKIKISNNSNFKFNENFNNEKISKIFKEKNFDNKKISENLELKYNNNFKNRLYNSEDIVNNESMNYLNNKDFNYTNRDDRSNKYKFDRGVKKENVNKTYNSIEDKKEDNQYINNIKNREENNNRKFYNFQKNNSNEGNRISRSPQISYIKNSQDINLSIGNNNYITEIKVKLFLIFLIFKENIR